MIIAEYMDVILREFEEKDIPLKVEWINNPENNKYLHYELPLRADKTLEWFRKKDNTKRLDCVIEYNGIPVGVIGLLQIDNTNSKAEYYITIGDTSFKRKGIATKATKAIINYGFNTLKLHKIYLTVDSENEVAIRLYERSGFKREGYFVDDFFVKDSELINRERYDVIKKHPQAKLYFEITAKKKSFTEIHELKNAEKENKIFIKRDDLIPFSFGGNKARKAINFFNEIDAGAYDCVVTYGSSSSNHCRIIANMAASRKMPCYIIGPKEASIPTFNSKMMAMFGAELTVVPASEVHDTIENKIKQLQKSGKKPYFIAGGGHGNLGTQAYVDCYEEILNYEHENGIYFDYIFLASGTGTTQAGLVCGQLMHNDSRKIVGISIARKNPRGRQVVVESVRDYLNINSDENIIFDDSYICGGYGQYNSEISKLIEYVMEKYGIPLDPTYTGKAFWGMEKYLISHKVHDKKVLFVHTGGTPIFYDWMK